MSMKIDDDQAAQVTQTHLARDFVGSFQIGAGGGSSMSRP
jgi:hypothetical protein